ncbi:hypothetical protein Tco_0648869 [Tanacetum coccineum]
MSGNCQKVLVDYFFNNNLKYLQGGVSTMTYTTSITKTKAAQYDLPGIEDMVPNLWVPVKVAYDKHALWGISHWRKQRKTFYGYARGLQSTHDVYFTKHILAVTQVEKRVEDLQLGVKSYQNKINVTKPETTKSGIRKRDPYTPYQDPQGFIYVNNNKRNSQNRRDLPRDIPLVSVEVLRYEKRSKSENKGKVPTKMELKLEQTQQSTSYEVSVCTEGVEELKRKVKIKGEKKEALLTLRQKPEHQSDTQVITVKMEILLEPTSNKLLVDSIQAGNPVKEILFKLNLPDNRVDPHGFEGYLKMEVKVPDSNCLKDS